MPAADTAQPTHEPRARWATVGWIVTSLLIAALIGGVWLRVHDRSAATNLSNSIIKGTRPAAPALPTSRLSGVRNPGLPAWYNARAGRQVPSRNARVLVVNWWASWCVPCIDEAPILERVARDYEGRVDFVGLNAGGQDLESDAAAFVKQHDISFGIVRGRRSDEDRWDTHGFPETYVIGSDGRISSFVNGPVDRETLTGLIDDELSHHRAAS